MSAAEDAKKKPGWPRLLVLALVALVLAPVIYWIGLELNEPNVLNAEPTPAFTVPERAEGTGHLSFLAVGDTGHPNNIQAHVAASMAREARRESAAFVLMLGDNFYFSGVESVDDPQWRTTFEEPFDRPGLDIPFHAVLGNHDYSGNPEAQLRYAEQSQRWSMPDRYYAFTRSLGNGVEARFIGIDTERIAQSTEAARKQRQWLRDQLADPSIEWEFVWGHRPIRSGNGVTEPVRKVLQPILTEGGADVYFAGHKHHLGILEGEAPPLQVISGAGSDPRSVQWNDQTVYASAQPGFVSCRLSADELLIKIIHLERPVFSFKEDLAFVWTVQREAAGSGPKGNGPGSGSEAQSGAAADPAGPERAPETTRDAG